MTAKKISAAKIHWRRSDPADLEKFDEGSKECGMNCGQAKGDPRSRKEMKYQCYDCLPLPREGVPRYLRSTDDSGFLAIQIREASLVVVSDLLARESAKKVPRKKVLRCCVRRITQLVADLDAAKPLNKRDGC